MYFWGGKYRRLPEDFSFPDCGPGNLFQLWVCGNKNEGWPPMRLVEATDVKTKDQKKRLCDARFLMRRIDEKARSIEIDTTKIIKIETAILTFENARKQ